MQQVEKPKPLAKISLLDAAEDLEMVCNEIDNADEIDKHLLSLFRDSLDNLESSVDKRIRYLSYAEAMAKQAKDMRDKWVARARSMERTIEWIKRNTSEVMKMYPDLPFKGEMGSFKMVKNSIAALETDIKTAPRTFDVIESTHGSKLPSEYVTFQQVQIVDKEKLKRDMATGRVIPGASFIQGEHVRMSLDKK